MARTEQLTDAQGVRRPGGGGLVVDRRSADDDQVMAGSEFLVSVPASRFVATINTPGFLPDTTEEPPAFATAREAWTYLTEVRTDDEDSAAEREHCSDCPWGDTHGYSSVRHRLHDLAAMPDAPEGDVVGWTPGACQCPEVGLQSPYDLGLAYSVTRSEG